MKLIAIPLSILAVATLGACASRPADTFPRASIAPQPVAYHTGTGTITQVAASPSYYGNNAGRTAPATSSAGGSAGANIGVAGASTALNRLTIRMDDGKTMQYIDTDASEFRPGMRVELLPDHTIRVI
jgi:outer membrane lipoprotein SlyB